MSSRSLSTLRLSQSQRILQRTLLQPTIRTLLANKSNSTNSGSSSSAQYSTSQRSLGPSNSKSSGNGSSSGKPIVLEQPDKFRPPSHPSTLTRRKKRNSSLYHYYGRNLSKEEKQELDSKQYPYMFPPQGSFTHWFLTNRSIHLWIAFVS